MKILFLLKKQNNYGNYSFKGLSSGLFNSAKMTEESLEEHLDIEADLKICIDGNSIDKELNEYRPDVCIIEAIWVTPKKIQELQKLYKDLLFVIRIHSEVPFLANEGVAIDWIKEYKKISNVSVAFNSKEAQTSFMATLYTNFPYLPNIYSGCDDRNFLGEFKNKKVIDIGCFGALRPMKNQLFQAFASISLGNYQNKLIRFHVNSTRQEQGGESVVKNLRALFKNTKHELVEHSWLPHEEFLGLISNMDLGMQLSFNESFNIVAADFVSQGIPIIVGNTIEWLPEESKTSTTNIEAVVKKMLHALKNGNSLVRKEKKSLKRYNEEALEAWEDFITTC